MPAAASRPWVCGEIVLEVLAVEAEVDGVLDGPATMPSLMCIALLGHGCYRDCGLGARCGNWLRCGNFPLPSIAGLGVIEDEGAFGARGVEDNLAGDSFCRTDQPGQSLGFWQA